MHVTIVGADGFVGSAFVRLLEERDNVTVSKVTRQNFKLSAHRPSDVVVEAACNSKKFLADEDPLREFEASVTHRLETLEKFPAALHLHISSVDIYSDLGSSANTREEVIPDIGHLSRYGFHKLLAENLVQHYAPRWLIIRLAGMVGPGLRKNPVFDILNGKPLRIHPDSRYQFLSTDDVARIVWSLVERNISNEIFNVCGDGLVSMREIAEMSGSDLDLTALPAGTEPRVVDASNEKIRKLFSIPSSRTTIQEFVATHDRRRESV